MERRKISEFIHLFKTEELIKMLQWNIRVNNIPKHEIERLWKTGDPTMMDEKYPMVYLNIDDYGYARFFYILNTDGSYKSTLDVKRKIKIM